MIEAATMTLARCVAADLRGSLTMSGGQGGADRKA
jgi:hypothetical protein